MFFSLCQGCYCVCDWGYTNGEGFLASYREHLYHLSEWDNGACQPHITNEYFNLKHSRPRNIYFGLLKGR